MTKIYIASKTVHAAKWRELRNDDVQIISTWIDEAGPGETKSFSDLWFRCVKEASEADATIIYREPGEILKGAFIEVGAALANDKFVYAVGCSEFSFIHHNNVSQYETFEQALNAAIKDGVQ